jgi:hypothetical protein
LDVGDHGVALVGGTDHPDLHVDDQERSCGSLWKGAHRCGMVARTRTTPARESAPQQEWPRRVRYRGIRRSIIGALP